MEKELLEKFFENKDNYKYIVDLSDEIYYINYKFNFIICSKKYSKITCDMVDTYVYEDYKDNVLYKFAGEYIVDAFKSAFEHKAYVDYKEDKKNDI